MKHHIYSYVRSPKNRIEIDAQIYVPKRNKQVHENKSVDREHAITWPAHNNNLHDTYCKCLNGIYMANGDWCFSTGSFRFLYSYNAVFCMHVIEWNGVILLRQTWFITWLVFTKKHSSVGHWSWLISSLEFASPIKVKCKFELETVNNI